jgi:Zn-finger nucleic acid-binding protein
MTRMPMHCPRCHTADLSERDRDGVKIDICTSCRGVWLDRGELDRLIARANENKHDDRDDDDDDDDYRRRRGGGRQRGSWWDIFD